MNVMYKCGVSQQGEIVLRTALPISEEGVWKKGVDVMLSNRQVQGQYLKRNITKKRLLTSDV